MASTCASSATSQWIASVLWPLAESSSAAERTAFSFQSASATAAPDCAKACAVARPRPDAAPVTSATLFSNEMFMVPCSLRSANFVWLARTLLEYVFRHRHGREHVGPPDIEGEMRDRLGDLGLGQAIVHPDIQMTGELRDLARGNQRADRDEAAVARHKVGAQPQVAEQHVGRVLRDARQHGAEPLADGLGAVRRWAFV